MKKLERKENFLKVIGWLIAIVTMGSLFITMVVLPSMGILGLMDVDTTFTSMSKGILIILISFPFILFLCLFLADEEEEVEKEKESLAQAKK